ncbi:ROK family protein [Rhizobium leucaenae]|uniref:Polyphosphate glucokinase n=1 Tax=Rhizobium leucaenae TaxID=29450 RepID=A0A7W7EMX3_9HYPH|nr:ROK family protein [Rhizobium leucaenae]MBB4569718.1 polyphosphate glucokinase [Rhizobium leucaenae]MBB6299770.1 polyphosphate glucokinase [Rhizobium leucaenae]
MADMTEAPAAEKTRSHSKPKADAAPADRIVLAVDIGGSHVKAELSSGSERRAVASGPRMTATKMVAALRDLTADWHYDLITMGYPGPVIAHRAAADPFNLGSGWKNFDFEAALGKPVRMVNDALMQAIGSYEAGRMLFLGLGTGLGSAMIAESICMPLELAHMPYRKATFEDYVGERGLERRGKGKWRKSVSDVVERLDKALQPNYIVIGGGNVEKLKELPPKCRRGSNDNAFRGGFRVWLDDSLRF